MVFDPSDPNNPNAAALCTGQPSTWRFEAFVETAGGVAPGGVSLPLEVPTQYTTPACNP